MIFGVTQKYELRVSYKYCAKFPGKHLEPLLRKLQAWGLQRNLKKAPKKMFSREFFKFFQKTFFTEHLNVTGRRNN